jgi:hypothetical protein
LLHTSWKALLQIGGTLMSKLMKNPKASIGRNSRIVSVLIMYRSE